MPHPDGNVSTRKELADLTARRDALRQAATLRGASLRPTLDAALAELDAAIDALAAAEEGTDGGPQNEASLDALHAERRLLRALFNEAPVALILVERDGTVRRVNQAAGELLDTGTGYATGRPFKAFVDLPSRRSLGKRKYATSSTAWQGVFSAMTDKQVAAISGEILQELRR